jgi:transcriptional regulator with XRE-family HTH domain
MTDVRILVAKNIKRYREIFGLSQMELAEKIGCSPTLVGKIEIMKRFPSANNLNRIAEAFKIDPAELFAITGESEAINAKKSQQERYNLLKQKILKAIDEELL